jgi:hypothetical protein
MKVLSTRYMVSASGYRIASLHASGANSNAGDLARGESSGDRLGFCGTAVPHRLYLLSCLALASGRRGSGAAARHTKVTSFSPSHIPGRWHDA